MRNLVLQQAAISLDGYICEEGTEFWRSFGPVALPPAPDDDEYEEYFLAGMSRAGTHIMGRVTYESMADTWPASTDPVAPLMNDTRKWCSRGACNRPAGRSPGLHAETWQRRLPA